MTQDENSTPKKKSKKWPYILGAILALSVIGSFLGEDSSTPTPTETTSPEATVEPEKVAQFTSEITRWEPINPASGRAVFTIRNVGEVAGAPGSCYIRVQDTSNTYKGSDYILVENVIEPGAKFMGNVVLTVTNEGALFVDKGKIDCT